MKKLVLLIILVLLAVSCDNPVSVENGDVNAAFKGEDFTAYNGTTEQIHYLAIESNLVPLIDWYPGKDGPVIKNKSVKTFSNHEVMGLDAVPIEDAEVYFFYWFPYEGDEYPKVELIKVKY